MSNFNFNKYKKGIIKIQIQSIMPEKFINLLWKNNIKVKNIKKINITTVVMDINLKDYSLLKNISRRTNTKMKIIDRSGISFFVIKTRNRKALIGGVFVFIGIIYFLSTFIWSIDIVTEKNISPFEMRDELKNMGVVPGVSKKNIDVEKIEEKFIKDNDAIMWVRARIDGAKLKINIAERQEPPKIEQDDTICDIVAKKDGEIVRVYSSAGTAIVKKGDIVKKNDILVKGEQGKEESVYPVHAQGDVIAKTFYEEVKEVSLKKVEKYRTGKKEKSVYLKLGGKNICLKKSNNKFKLYDKIVIDKPFMKECIYYELKEKTVNLKKEDVIKKTADSLFAGMIVNIDKSVKIVDKIINAKQLDDKYQVRVMLVLEENIGKTQIRQVQEDDPT